MSEILYKISIPFVGIWFTIAFNNSPATGWEQWLKAALWTSPAVGLSIGSMYAFRNQ